MFRQTGRLYGSKVLGFLSLAIMITTSSGCATRALMSSDRYEKPKTDTQQFRTTDEISQSWQPGMIQIEQTFHTVMAHD